MEILVTMSAYMDIPMTVDDKFKILDTEDATKLPEWNDLIEEIDAVIKSILPTLPGVRWNEVEAVKNEVTQNWFIEY